jgi:hypothetical protein
MDEYHGHWWIAQRPHRKVYGVLRVSDDGSLQLDTYGALGEEMHFSRAATSPPQRILGQLENTSGATLDGCLVKRAQVLVDPARETWVAHQVVFGLHFEPDEAWAFYGASFQIPLLTRWVRPQSVEFSFESDHDAGIKKVGVATMVESLPLWQTGGHTVELVKSAGVRESTEGVFELTARFDVRALCADRVAANDFVGTTIRPLQLLLGLSTGKHTAPVRGQVFNEAYSPSVPLRAFDRRWHAQDVRARAADEMYGFHFAEFAELPAESRAKWLDRFSMLTPVVDLYLATLQSPGYAEQKFVFLVQALETYHRITDSSRVLAESTWSTLRAKLSECVNDVPQNFPGRSDAVQTLVGKLQYLNEPGLRSRLKQMILSLGEQGNEVVGAGVSAFVDRVTNTRNYYTHWSADSAPKAMRGEGLLHASLRLQAIVELLLLREIGFEGSSRAAQEVIRRRVAWLPA